MNSSPWISKLKLRLFITGLFATGIGLVLFPILAALIVVSLYAVVTISSTYAKNIRRYTEVNSIITTVNTFYEKRHRYPYSLEELPEYSHFEGYYGYKIIDNGSNCIISGLKTDGSLFTQYCIPVPTR